MQLRSSLGECGNRPCKLREPRKQEVKLSDLCPAVVVLIVDVLLLIDAGMAGQRGCV